jgi:hypothetical protein
MNFNSDHLSSLRFSILPLLHMSLQLAYEHAFVAAAAGGFNPNLPAAKSALGRIFLWR